MCLPSHREPFGLVYVEAALAEKPVIACDAGGAPEIIAHGETGLLVSAAPTQHSRRSPTPSSRCSTTATSRRHGPPRPRAGPRPLRLARLLGPAPRTLRQSAWPRAARLQSCRMKVDRCPSNAIWAVLGFPPRANCSVVLRAHGGCFKSKHLCRVQNRALLLTMSPKIDVNFRVKLITAGAAI